MKAFITGITGQDGSYLAELLLSKGYDVHGLVRRTSTYNLQNIEHIKSQLNLHYGDLSDASNVHNIIMDIKPNEVYNLGAQSHVSVSFKSPAYTADANGVGVLHMLEAVRKLSEHQICKFYQASTSELFGKVQQVPQTESTPFYPRSPYAVAKLYGYWITVNYRESYNLFACNGILFNHESPRRGVDFVTRKITHGLVRAIRGEGPVQLGNLDARRDWGHAKDFVKAMWLMLQQTRADDYVIATGVQQSVRDFCEVAAKILGKEIIWTGVGSSEKGIDRLTGNVLIEVSEKFYRPAEVNTLLGNSMKARSVLQWKPEYTFYDLVKEMVMEDMK
ncbi:GDP-mannose 4,6-dehydratase [bacterium]|nr:GDP-mannose 4,6-dehydratase [bacterium]